MVTERKIGKVNETMVRNNEAFKSEGQNGQGR